MKKRIINKLSSIVITFLLSLMITTNAVYAENIDSDVREIIDQTVSTKRMTTKTIGAVTLKGVYDGKDSQGCHLITVQETIFPFNRPENKRYRVCGSDIQTQGFDETIRYPFSDKRAMDIYGQVAREGLLYGDASGNYGGFQITGRRLNNIGECSNIEMVITYENYSIHRLIEKICK